MKEWAKVAGGALLTLALLYYGIRLLPFVTADPEHLPRSQGIITEKATDSLSGSTRAEALTYLVTIEISSPPTRIESILSGLDYDQLTVGDPIDVVIHGRHTLAAADLRWRGPHRSRFWLILAAVVLVGAETSRRFIRLVRARPASETSLPAQDLQ